MASSDIRLIDKKLLRDVIQRVEDDRTQNMLTGKRIGPGPNDVTMAGAPAGRVWVRSQNYAQDAVPAIGNLPPLINLEVDVRRNKDGELEVIGWRRAGVSEPFDGKLTPFTGYGSNFSPGRVTRSTGGGLSITIEDFAYNGRYYRGEMVVTPPGTAGKMAYCPIVFNPLTSAFSQLTGTLFDTGVNVSDADALASVTVAQGLVPLGGFIVPNGATALEGLRWVDARQYISPVEPQHNYSATAAPTAGDDSADGYSIGSRWLDTVADAEYVCADATAGAAVWKRTDGGGGGGVTDTVTTVNPALMTRFDPTAFDVDDLGGGTALVKLLAPTVGIRRWIGTVIYEQELSAAGTFDITSIPPDYKDLEITLLTRSSDANAQAVDMYANNDRTQTNYRNQVTTASTTITAVRQDAPRITTTTPNTNTERQYTKIWIGDYANPNYRKQAWSQGVRRDTAADNFTEIHTWHWENTAAINRLTFEIPTLINFQAGSLCRVVAWREEVVGANGAAQLTTTLTGNIDNFAVGTAPVTLLRMNNATDATLRGMAAGAPGQRVIIQSIGAGNVFLANDNAGSTAANRLLNLQSAIDTPLAAGGGCAEYVYDATTQRWRLVVHEQGAALPYTCTWGVASGTPPAVGNGTLTAVYVVRGRAVKLSITLVAGTTTTFGTGAWTFSLPVTPAAAAGGVTIATDTGVATYANGTRLSAGGAVTSPTPNYTATFPFTWGSTDVCRIDVEYFI